MKNYLLSALAILLCVLINTACSSQEGDQAGKPAFMQKNDSISQQPAMGDTANTGS